MVRRRNHPRPTARVRLPLALLGTALAFTATPALANADFSATSTGDQAAFTGDGENDTLSISWGGRLSPALIGLTHNRFAAGDTGFASVFDFDSTQAGEQTLELGGSVDVDGGGG